MRVAVFIDGGYFEKVIKNEFGEVPIDFAKLVEILAGGRELLRTYYYNCLPYQSNLPSLCGPGVFEPFLDSPLPSSNKEQVSV